VPLPVNILPKLSPNEIKEIQRIICSILYYAQAANITDLMALSSITIKQSKGTTNTMQKAKQFLIYLATYPDATIRFRASNIIMNVHSDASYLSKLVLKVERADISLWDGPPKTETLSS
jgi:hypothetical protein